MKIDGVDMPQPPTKFKRLQVYNFAMCSPDMGLPNAVTGVFQGMLLFYLLAADVLVKYRVRVVSKKPVILKTEAVE